MPGVRTAEDQAPAKTLRRVAKPSSFFPMVFRSGQAILIDDFDHRRTGIFLPGGAVNHFPKKISQVAQIFTKESKRNEGHIATTQAVLAYEGGSIQFFRVNTKSEHKLRLHKQTFGKIATSVTYIHIYIHTSTLFTLEIYRVAVELMYSRK